VEPNGRILIGDYSGNSIYRLVPFLPSADPNGYTISSEDGRAYFSFAKDGRHLKTVDALKTTYANELWLRRGRKAHEHA
jgi:hypothetical protein